jgi:hypothetical protein
MIQKIIAKMVQNLQNKFPYLQIYDYPVEQNFITPSINIILQSYRKNEADSFTADKTLTIQGAYFADNKAANKAKTYDICGAVSAINEALKSFVVNDVEILADSIEFNYSEIGKIEFVAAYSFATKIL